MSLLFDGPPPSVRAQVVATIGTLRGVCKGSVWSPRAGPLLMSIPGGIECVKDSSLVYSEVHVYAVGHTDIHWFVVGVRTRRGTTTFHELCGFQKPGVDDLLLASAAQKPSMVEKVQQWLTTARTEAMLS